VARYRDQVQRVFDTAALDWHRELSLPKGNDTRAEFLPGFDPTQHDAYWAIFHRLHELHGGERCSYNRVLGYSLHMNVTSGEAKGWELLLQLDSGSGDPNLNWGSAGCIYFWIRDVDLRARRFDDLAFDLSC
jgi:hypothetical protein